MDKSEIKELTLRQLLAKVLKILKPHKGLLFLTIILTTIFSMFTSLSILMIQPVLSIIFDVDISSSGMEMAAGGGNPLGSLKDAFFMQITELVQVPGNLQATLLRLGLLIALVFALKNLFKYWGSVTSAKLEENIVRQVRDDLFRKLTSFSIDYFVKRRQGELLSIVTNDVGVLNHTTVFAFTGTVKEFIQILIFIFTLISISPSLTLIAFSSSIFSVIMIRFSVKYLKKYASRMQAAMADYTTTLQEMLQGIRIIKAYNAKEMADERFKKDSEHYVRSAVKMKKITALVPAINEVVAILALCIVLMVGGNAVLVEKTIRADELLTFLFALFALMTPVNIIVNSYTQFQRGIVSGSRIYDVLETNSTIIEGKDKIASFEKEIRLEGVKFSYTDTEILKGIDITIPKGKKIALVGGSGSGKSTILDLITRFYDPSSGSISIDGKNIRELDSDSYRSLFGIVSQETILFNDTVRHNIRYGYGQATDGDMAEAAKIANAHNFISKLPQGFETRIGDRGITLSGGERQRLAIARALIRKPQILIFDEATSALDVESEKIVQDAINNSLKDKTAIIVAHRLSTIIDCDVIFALKDGQVAEYGSHKELLERNGIYKALYDIQFNTNTEI